MNLKVKVVGPATRGHTTKTITIAWFDDAKKERGTMGFVVFYPTAAGHQSDGKINHGFNASSTICASRLHTKSMQRRDRSQLTDSAKKPLLSHFAQKLCCRLVSLVSVTGHIYFSEEEKRKGKRHFIRLF